MAFMLPILYAALAGLGLTLGVEVAKTAKPGNWKAEMRQYQPNRLRPCIGADDCREVARP